MKFHFYLFLASAIAFLPLHANESGDFVEKEQPFLRSALLIPGKPVNAVRRGVLIRLGNDLWTCFDPDLLRYAAVWKSLPDQPPLTLDSMAAVSYPDKQAKADKPPSLQGTLLTSTLELPGAGISELPLTDPRTATLTDGTTKIGPLPVDKFRWQGLSLRGDKVVLKYRIGSRDIRETTRALAPDLIERIITVSPGKDTIALHLDSSPGKISSSGASQSILIESGNLPHFLIRGNAPFNAHSHPQRGAYFSIPQSTEPTSFHILRSSTLIAKSTPQTSIPETTPPLFGEKIKSASPVPDKTNSPISTRIINLPFPNPWKRTIRPTDIAFLSNGDALLTTLDGDVWRIADIETPFSTWSRAAFGIFEPMSIEVNAKDEVFVLGRGEITRLADTDSDGFFDDYLCASDAPLQTIHTRDFATSLGILPDSSFVVGRSGLMDVIPRPFNENSPHRGSILKVSPDGTTVTTLADGLRIPYIGVRSDGTVFSSDQQGEFTPSTPVHLITGDVPYLGYEPSDFRNKKQPTEPLLWFPYFINRSGSTFANLPAQSFPSLGDRFAHLSWGGRIFIIETPADGQPFAWKLPADFAFPILGAATQSTTGKFFATGIGISGYLPTTERQIGLAEISQQQPIATPVTLDISRDQIRVAFRDPLPPAANLSIPRPQLDLWNIQRSSKYGSGHFRWDGKPGEHAVSVGKIKISEDRKTISFSIPPVFKSDILRLKIHFSVSGQDPYEIELYNRPSHLLEANPTELIAVAAREKLIAAPIVAGDPQRGATSFKNYGCTGCHSLDGIKLTGPPLNGIGSRKNTDLDAFLKNSILNPASEIAAGYEPSMPSFAGVIPEQEIEHLVAFLKGLK